jgi:hypothetical protein
MIAILLALALFPAFAGTSRATDLPAPTGPVFLAVTGAIQHANQGPSDVWDQSPAGPTWIVYPDGETAEHGDKWAWAAYLITVE